MTSAAPSTLAAVSIADEPRPPADLEKGAAPLDADQRRLCTALRDAARIVGRAGLPAEYRVSAYRRVLDLELDALELDTDPPPALAAVE